MGIGEGASLEEGGISKGVGGWDAGVMNLRNIDKIVYYEELV